MKKVFVSGCYDIVHAGHIQFFEEARALGDYLIVSFASEPVLWHHKQRKPSIPDEHKKVLLESLRMVDKVILGTGMKKGLERLAAANGFDSWIMFNVYPQRATDPNDMDKTPDRALCDENLRWLQAVLAQTEPTMWAAWGTLIEKRDYLPGLMREMVALTREREIPWVTFGKRSKKGHPHHPLYLRKDSTPEPFDVENYLDTCF